MNGKTYRMEHSDEAMSEEMDLFNIPPTVVSCQSREKWYYSSKNPVNDNILLFDLDIPKGFMLDTKSINLILKAKVVLADGSKIPAMPSTLWTKDPITEAEKTALLAADVYPENMLHSTMFKRVSVRIQDTTTESCDYSLQTYVDKMLDFSPASSLTMEMMRGSRGSSAKSDNASISLTNTGYDSLAYLRSSAIAESRVFELRGPVAVDVFQQEKPLMGQTRVLIELERNSHEKTVCSIKKNADFKLEITESKLEVQVLRMRSDIEEANEMMLLKRPALYPYERTCIKKFYLSSGIYSYEVEDMHHGFIPSQVTVFMIPSANYNGAYNLNFIKLVNNNLSSIGFKVDNMPMPGAAMSLKHGTTLNDCVLGDAVTAIANAYPDAQWSMNQQFRIPMFVFDLRNTSSSNLLPLVRKGLSKLEVKFETPLAANSILFVSARFPAVMSLDGNRKVTLQ
jgi:hypothetical protein